MHPTLRAARAGEVTAQPEYYGLLAARQLEGGRFVPTGLTAPNKLPNLTAWATLAPNGRLRVAIDNLATTGPAQPVSISVPGYTIAGEESMIGPSPSARGAIVLGAARVTAEARWQPKGTSADHTNPIVMRPASATIVTLSPTSDR